MAITKEKIKKWGEKGKIKKIIKALKEKGLGILVAEQPRASDAEFIINDTPEVKKVLEFFIDRAQKS